MTRTIVAAALAAFSALSAAALWRHGYWGIVAPHFESLGAFQVLVDVVIALTLVMVWMWRDARAAGRNPWPWIALTLATGSIGPLVYLLVRPAGEARRAAVPA